MTILVLNCGSSSIKYKLFAMPEERVLQQGLVERVGREDARLKHEINEYTSATFRRPVNDHTAGLAWIFEVLLHSEYGALRDLREIDAIGHRVVHAGERYSGSVLVTDDVIQALEECIELAPLHNPPNLAGIRACRRLMPDTPMVCVFDNALHSTLPPEAYLYGLPYSYAEKYRIRRYGFHGIAFRSAILAASRLLGRAVEKMRIVTLMLGSGCTANAMKCGHSIDVSTGFTPLEGLLQSTRSGDLDPAVVLYLMQREGLSPAQMNDLLNRQSGLLGLSGVSSDVREIQEAAHAGNLRAQQALNVFAYRCRKYIGAYAAALGGIDALIFAGGIGQNSAELRAQICTGLEFLGIALDDHLNREQDGKAGLISRSNSAVQVVVVVVDEELIIAQDTLAVLS